MNISSTANFLRRRLDGPPDRIGIGCRDHDPIRKNRWRNAVRNSGGPFFLACALLAAQSVAGAEGKPRCISHATFVSILDRVVSLWTARDSGGDTFVLVAYPAQYWDTPLPAGWTIYRYEKSARRACVVSLGYESVMRRNPIPDPSVCADIVEPDER